MLNTALLIGQVIVSVVIIITVLLQAQGTGLGSTWGGGGETFHTRRGVEKVIFGTTVVSIILFTIFSIAIILVK